MYICMYSFVCVCVRACRTAKAPRNRSTDIRRLNSFQNNLRKFRTWRQEIIRRRRQRKWRSLRLRPSSWLLVLLLLLLLWLM